MVYNFKTVIKNGSGSVVAPSKSKIKDKREEKKNKKLVGVDSSLLMTRVMTKEPKLNVG
jgi:hypothetical protein